MVSSSARYDPSKSVDQSIVEESKMKIDEEFKEGAAGYGVSGGLWDSNNFWATDCALMLRLKNLCDC